MKCLVTGGSGFIGSHLAHFLVEKGHEVVVVDKVSPLKPIKKVKYHRFCIKEIDKMDKFFDVDYVFHLAAQTSIPFSILNPAEVFAANLLGTINVLELCRLTKVKRLVFSSTSAVYGEINKPPLREDMPTQCLNPYSQSKLSAEKIISLYHSLYGIPAISLRYFNVYGENQAHDNPYCPVISIFLEQKRKNLPLTITGDGSQKRDFINVKDVVRANYLAAFTKDESCLGQVFNIGSGKCISIKEIADLISSDQKYIGKRKAEIDFSLANISKAKRLLGFTPSISVHDWINNDTNLPAPVEY